MSTFSEPTELTIVRRVGSLQFDATFREAHELSQTVTENPIETGVSIADHKYRNPRKVTITAGVSDTPLDRPASDQFLTGSSRSQRALELLEELMLSIEPFDVQTGLRLYKNMVCTSVRAEQDAKTAHILFFTAELREVIIVSTQTVKYPPKKEGATARQGGSVKNKGQAQGKTPGGDAAAKDKASRSISKKIFSTSPEKAREAAKSILHSLGGGV